MFRILLSTYAVCVAMTGSVRASELSLTYGFEQSLTLDEAGPTEDSVGSGVGETSQPVRVSSVHTDSDADLLLVNDSFDQSIELNPVTGLERFFEQLGEGSWISGAEATFMKVNGDVDGRMTMSFDDSGTAGTDYRGIGGRGLDTSSVAPRVWIGRQLTPKWAIVTRY